MATATLERALEAMKAVSSLGGPALEQRVEAEIGDPMIAVFATLAKAMSPEDADAARATQVHLMVLAYLLRGELGG